MESGRLVAVVTAGLLAALLAWRTYRRRLRPAFPPSVDPRGLVDTNPGQAVDPKAASLALDLAGGRLLSAGLIELNLKKAGLTVLPPQIGTLKQLTKLDVSLSPLSDLPAEMVGLESLRILFLLGCKFTSIPSVVGQLASLYMLSFKSNALAHIDEDALAPSLRWLILTDNQLERLPSRLPLRLTKVMLTNNRLCELPASICGCKELELIRLADNRLHALPEGFLELPRLSWLGLAGNPLVAVAGVGALPQPRQVAASELEIHEQIGAGGGGFVHRVTWTPPGLSPRPAALKLFRDAGAVTDGDPSHEIEIGAVLSHPHVVRVLGASAPPRLGLVLELLDCQGGSWSELGRPPTFDTCARDTYPPEAVFKEATAVRSLCGVAAAAAHLHGSRTAHGDLYAHNTLVARDGTPKVGDFGAAFSYAALGAAAAPLVERVEVRAFGCLAEELHQRLAPTAGAASELVRRQLAELVRRCMQPQVASRPSFAELSAELQQMARAMEL